MTWRSSDVLSKLQIGLYDNLKMSVDEWDCFQSVKIWYSFLSIKESSGSHCEQIERCLDEDRISVSW